jgi:hypothetical protein
MLHPGDEGLEKACHKERKHQWHEQSGKLTYQIKDHYQNEENQNIFYCVVLHGTNVIFIKQSKSLADLFRLYNFVINCEKNNYNNTKKIVDVFINTHNFGKKLNRD